MNERDPLETAFNVVPGSPEPRADCPGQMPWGWVITGFLGLALLVAVLV